MNVHRISPTHHAVTEQRPTGFGPTIWVGELRTSADDSPVLAYWDPAIRAATQRPTFGPTHCYPVTVATTEEDLLAKLTDRADTIAAT